MPRVNERLDQIEKRLNEKEGKLKPLAWIISAYCGKDEPGAYLTKELDGEGRPMYARKIKETTWMIPANT